MGWWITLGILFLLAILPLGVSAVYNASGAVIRVIAGPVRFTVFPMKKKEKKPKKEKTPKPAEPVQAQPAEAPASKQSPAKTPPKPEKPKEQGGSVLDFLPLVKVVLDFLGGFFRKLRINNLELKLIMAGDDPCDLGVNYGRAWAAVGNLLPQLERVFVIKKRNIEVECDFWAEQMTVIAAADITITIGRTLSLLVVLAYRGIREFLKIKMKRKGGAAK